MSDFQEGLGENSEAEFTETTESVFPLREENERFSLSINLDKL